MTKPRWCLGMLGTRGTASATSSATSRASATWRRSAPGPREQFDPRLNWGDVEWIKKRWGGKLILKGIMDVEDARLAVDSGADALVVSNHGGRQLDGAPRSIAALPAIADAVGSRIEVWMDGGIRSGQDVLKAWALGAHGTMIGRAYAYGLGAMGEAGVAKALEDHPQGARPDDGVLRPHPHRQRRSPHPAAGHLLTDALIYDPESARRPGAGAQGLDVALARIGTRHQ